MADTSGIDTAIKMAPLTAQSVGDGMRRGGLEPLASSRLGEVVTDVATQSSESLKQYVLSNGQASIEAGISELQEAGVMTDQLAESFRQVDYTNPESVSKAMGAMCKMKQTHSADQRGMSFQKGLLDEGLANLGPDATAEDVARMEEDIRKTGIEKARTDLDLDALNAYVARFPSHAEEVGKTQAANDVNNDRKLAKEARGYLAKIDVQAVDALNQAVDVTKEAFELGAKNGTAMWGIQANTESVRKFGNFMRTMASNTKFELHAGEKDRGVLSTFAYSLTAKAAEWLENNSLDYTDEERQALNMMTGALGTALAAYIKSMSGTAVTESERAFLMANLNIGNYANPRVMMRSLNNLIERTKTNIKKWESEALNAHPERTNQFFADFSSGSLVSQGMRRFQTEWMDRVLGTKDIKVGPGTAPGAKKRDDLVKRMLADTPAGFNAAEIKSMVVQKVKGRDRFVITGESGDTFTVNPENAVPKLLKKAHPKGTGNPNKGTGNPTKVDPNKVDPNKGERKPLVWVN